MYKQHKIQIAVLEFIVISISFFLNCNYMVIASAALTIVSIALAVYIATMSVLLGSPYAKAMNACVDEQDKTRTRLGVLSDYLRIAGILSVVTIAISSLYLLISPTNLSILEKIMSSLSFGLYSANIMLLWLIFKFLVNSLTKSVQ